MKSCSCGFWWKGLFELFISNPVSSCSLIPSVCEIKCLEILPQETVKATFTTIPGISIPHYLAVHTGHYRVPDTMLYTWLLIFDYSTYPSIFVALRQSLADETVVRCFSPSSWTRSRRPCERVWEMPRIRSCTPWSLFLMETTSPPYLSSTLPPWEEETRWCPGRMATTSRCCSGKQVLWQCPCAHNTVYSQHKP